MHWSALLSNWGPLTSLLSALSKESSQGAGPRIKTRTYLTRARWANHLAVPQPNHCSSIAIPVPCLTYSRNEHGSVAVLVDPRDLWCHRESQDSCQIGNGDLTGSLVCDGNRRSWALQYKCLLLYQLYVIFL